MEIISRRFRETFLHVNREFRWADSLDAGFSFPCDEQGNVLRPLPCQAAEDNLAGCLAGEMGGRKLLDIGVQRWSNSYMNPAVGRCRCGEEVMLDGFTNTCSCGRDYNDQGHLLAPRSQWGEDTGEHISDILRIA